MDLSTKSAIITGASQGIGAAIARRMALEGVMVILLARSSELMAAIAEEIRSSGGNCAFYGIDLSDHGQTMEVLGKIKELHGIPDIIVNNAGAGRFIHIEETDYHEARQMMHLPYLAAFDVTRFFIEDMLQRNTGNITFLNSPVSIQPWSSAVGYAAARWAIRGFAGALAADLYGSRITVTHIIAGKTTSNYWVNNAVEENRLPKIDRFFPDLSPEEVAKAVVKAIRKNRREVTLPSAMRLTYWLHNHFPWLVRWLVLSTGVKR